MLATYAAQNHRIVPAQSTAAAFYASPSSSNFVSLWRYHSCQYPANAVGGAQMHSYVYIGGVMHGNGFDLLDNRHDPRLHAGRWLSDDALQVKLAAAGASLGSDRSGEAGERRPPAKAEMRQQRRLESLRGGQN
eukprot:SAG22_NODE_4871_length_1146_cov_1.194842_2_plen_134_part_00